MARRYQMPQSRVVGTDGRALPEWHQYLAGIEEMSRRIAANVEALGASPTNAEIATAFNALLTALQSANLQDAS